MTGSVPVYDDELWSGRRPGLSRRGALKLATAGVLGAGLAGVSLSRRPAPSRLAADPGPPRRGGILRIAYADSPDSLDPQATFSFIARQVNTLVYDALTRIGEQSQPEPALARRWWPEKGGSEWVFELRTDVRFHHGRLLTAADVVATIERVENPANALSGAGCFGPIRRVTADGAHRVRLVYHQPFSEAPLVVADERAAILPAEKLDTLATHPLGTGPFRFVRYQPGSLIAFERNDAYALPGKPYLDGVQMRIIRDAVAQQGALLAGEIDLVTMLMPEAYLTLRKNARIQCYSRDNGSHHSVITQIDHGPFDKPQVREAFRHLLDRNLVLASALLGQGRIGNDIPIAPGDPDYPPLAQHTQDLDRVRALLAQAQGGPISLDLWTTSERPPAPKLALALAQSAAQVGIELNIRDVPYTEYVARVARKQAIYTSYQGAFPSLYQRVYRSYHSRGSSNYSRREPFPGSDMALETMLAQQDAAKRKAQAAALLQRYSVLGDRIVPYFQSYLAASTLQVRNFVPPQYSMIDFRRIWLSA